MIQRARAGRRLTALPAVALLAVTAVAAASSHTVRRGETLSSIALRNGTTVSALAAANGITNPDFIRAGQQLVIPDGATPVAAPAEATIYTVRRGDTLAAIARRHHTTVRAIAEANGISNVHRIIAGLELALPFLGTPQGEEPAAVHVEPTTVTHTVEPGDTVSSIAVRYGSTIRAVAAASGLERPDRIVVGQVLTVPMSGPAWLCPVQGPTQFVHGDWLYVKPDGRVHRGIDLFAARGTPVVAPVAGRAVQTSGSVGGNQVWFYGDDGVTYLMSHFDQLGARGRVDQGTVIGYVGNTGNARHTATHVHFEMRPGDADPVDPWGPLSESCPG